MIVEARSDTIKLCGNLLENHWLTLKSAITLLLRDHPSGIIIDCQGILECNPRGAETFIAATSFIKAHKAKVLFANLSPDLVDLLRSVPELRSGLLVAPTVEDARKALHEQRAPLVHAEGPLVLMPILSEHHPLDWLHHACQVAQLFHGTLYFAYFHVVPLTQPLDSPIEDEADLEAVLQAAQQTAKAFKIKSLSHVFRIRQAADCLKIVEKISPGAILCVLPHEASEFLQHLIMRLQKQANSEVIVLTPGQILRWPHKPGHVGLTCVVA